MAKFIIKFNDVVIDQVVVRPGDMNVGRRPGSDILLDNLAVSGNHATLFTVGEDTFVQDLNSTNGTFVNNKRITKHHLEHGDTITIGNHTLTYVNENAVKANPNLAKTVIINPQKQEEMLSGAGKAVPAPAAPPSATPTPAPAPAKPAPAAEPARIGSLFILSGANSGKRIDLTMPVTNLGRAGRRAGVISRTGQRYLLMPGDDGQTPRLNGVRVGNSGEELKNGDMIEVADARMQFYLKSN
jgi:pSer/pThr/pTyr-binding forkhead associated (FHA) protein